MYPTWLRRRRQGITSTILYTLCFVLPVKSIWPFPTKRFTKNSLMEAGSMGIANGERIVAFGDFNGDQFLDVLSLDKDQHIMYTYLWSHDDFSFHKTSSIQHPVPVYNVVPGDFTHDGKLDLLVMTMSTVPNRMDMVMYKGMVNGQFDPSPISVPPSTLSQPIPVDLDGDMKIDLLGIPSPQSSNGSPLVAWKNSWNASDPYNPLFSLASPQFNGTQCTLANPHSNAVIDLNGDCLADIFLVCDNGFGQKSFQIWINNKDAGFSLAQEDSLPPGTHSISFADVDRDGSIDMVFPTCTAVSSTTGVGSGCVINIAYNRQIPVCASATTPSVNKKGQRTCRPPEQLCIADPNFKFDLQQRSDNDAFVQIPLTSLLTTSASSAPSSSLLLYDTTSTPSIPLPIKLGDANLDGFPDFLLISASGNSHTPKLLFSEPCVKGLAGCDQNGNGRRGWRLVTKGAETLEAIKDARGVAYLDMDEDGTLDVMVQRTGGQGQTTVSFIQNNFYYDAFFLKAIVLNGACGGGWCATSNGTSYLPFGVSYSGASYKYTVLDTTGRRTAAQVGQLPQTSYHSLMTPYSFFGLGRTNNYIENLFVGSTKHTEQHFINIEGVIPNSRVVIRPPSTGDDGWRRELFLRPGEWIPWVTLTVIVTMIVLAVIIFVLHLNEKREDELERRRASHHINFDAL